MRPSRLFKRYAAVLFVLGLPIVTSAANNDELVLMEEEIAAIKEIQDNAVKVSGYVDAEYIIDSRPIAERDKYGFRMHHFSVFLTKNFGQNWRFFSEIEFEDGTQQDGLNPDANYGQIFAEAINITYQWTPGHFVRIGRDFTPTGIWSIDHYPPFVATQDKPAHVRTIFPHVIDGINSLGTFKMGNAFLKYHAYVANGDGTTGESDNNDEKALGSRVSMLLPYLDHMEGGFSTLNDTLGDYSKAFSWGGHAKISFRGVTLQSEFALSESKMVNSTKINKLGYYIQTSYDIGKWTLGYRYDFSDEDKSQAVNHDHNTAFLGYHVSPHIVCKIEHHEISRQNPNLSDFQKSIFSIAYYLGD